MNAMAVVSDVLVRMLSGLSTSSLELVKLEPRLLSYLAHRLSPTAASSSFKFAACISS